MRLNNRKLFIEDQLLTVIFDLLVEEVEDPTNHPDNPITLTAKEYQVLKVHSVDYLAMDCLDIPMPEFKKDKQLARKLEAKILEELEYKNIEQLETV